MLESLFNKFKDLQACNITKKRPQHRRFPVNIANFKNTYSEKHLRTAGFDSSYILHRKYTKIIQEADWPSRLDFCFFWSIKSILLTLICIHSFYHSLSFVATHCHFLLLALIRCHLFYHSLSLFITRCITRCHLLSLVTIRCHSLPFDVTRCTTCLSFYKRSLFYNVLLFTSFIIKTKTKKYLV